MSALEHDELGYRARELRALIREEHVSSAVRATIEEAACTLDRAEEDLAKATGRGRENFTLLVAVITAAGGEIRLSEAVQEDRDLFADRIVSFRDAATGEYVLRLERAE